MTYFSTFLIMCNLYTCFLRRIWYSIGVFALILHVFRIMQGWWTLNGLPKLNQLTKYHVDDPIGTPCSIWGGYLHWKTPNFCIGIGTNNPQIPLFFDNIGHIFAITDTYATLQPLYLPAPKPVFRHINSPWWHFFLLFWSYATSTHIFYAGSVAGQAY